MHKKHGSCPLEAAMQDGRSEKFCRPCQDAFNSLPVGALTRRWSAESADAHGNVSGLLCDACKQLVRKRNTRVCDGVAPFHFVNPNGCREAIVPKQQTLDFARLPRAQQDAVRDLHEQEVRSRLSWCLQQGLAPAHDHVHKAPGCDQNFMVSASFSTVVV